MLGDVLVRRLNLPLRDGSLKGKVYYKNNLDRQVKSHYRSPFPSYASRAGILGFLRMAPQGDNEYISKRIKTIQNNLPQLRVPTLLVGSKGDPVFGEAEAKVLRALIPNAELRVLNDGGHLLQEDRPDLLSSWIVDFLERLAPV